MRKWLDATFLLILAGCATTPAEIDRGPTDGSTVAEAPTLATEASSGSVAEDPRVQVDTGRLRLLEIEDSRVLDLPVLEELLVERPELDVSIARVLGRVGDRAAVPLLRELASESRQAVRVEVAFALGLLGGEPARAQLISLLKSEDQAVVSAAVLGLGLDPDPASLVPLAEVLRSNRSPVIKAEVLLSLPRYESPAAAKLATSSAQASDRRVRVAAIFALGRLGLVEGQSALSLGLGDSSPTARAMALRGLGRIADPEDLPRIAQLLEDPNESVRVNAVRATGRLLSTAPSGSAGAVAALATLREIASGRGPVGGVAVEALAGLPVEARGVADVLENLLITRDGAISNRALAGLARFDGPRATPHVEFRSSSPDPSVRAAAAIAIANLPVDPASTEILQRLFVDPEMRVRAAAAGAVRDLEWESFREPLIRLLDDPDVLPRAAAVDRLAERQEPVLEVNLRAALERGMVDADVDAALAVVSAAAAMQPSATAESVLYRALEAGAPLVRRAAAEALGVETAVEFPRGLGGDFEDLIALQSTRPVVILETDRGDIAVRLHPDDAPRTVESFLRLASSGYFDGVSFHRVVPGFVIQGGDPTGTGSGGPGYQIRDELSHRRYLRGTVGMALSGPDTGGSQFFITHAAQPHLDGGYTIFGTTIGGMDVVDQIEQGDLIRSIRVLSDVAPGTRLDLLSGPLGLDVIETELPGWSGAPVDPATVDALAVAARSRPWRARVTLAPSADEVGGRWLAFARSLAAADVEIEFWFGPSNGDVEVFDETGRLFRLPDESTGVDLLAALEGAR